MNADSTNSPSTAANPATPENPSAEPTAEVAALRERCSELEPLPKKLAELQLRCDQLEAANSALIRKNLEFEDKAKQLAAEEKLIVEKMARGLSREQATMVISRQRNFDKAKSQTDPAN